MPLCHWSSCCFHLAITPSSTYHSVRFVLAPAVAVLFISLGRVGVEVGAGAVRGVHVCLVPLVVRACGVLPQSVTMSKTEEDKAKEDKNIQMFKIRKLINSLERARGCAHSPRDRSVCHSRVVVLVPLTATALP